MAEQIYAKSKLRYLYVLSPDQEGVKSVWSDFRERVIAAPVGNVHNDKIAQVRTGVAEAGEPTNLVFKQFEGEPLSSNVVEVTFGGGQVLTVFAVNTPDRSKSGANTEAVLKFEETPAEADADFSKGLHVKSEELKDASSWLESEVLRFTNDLSGLVNALDLDGKVK